MAIVAHTRPFVIGVDIYARNHAVSILACPTGEIVDAHHPQHGRSLAGQVVMMPTSRGSCTGSGVLLDLALNGRAPAALVFREAEDVLTLGAGQQPPPA